MSEDRAPLVAPLSDPVVRVIGSAGVPTPGEALMLATLLSLEVDDPHPGIFTFVNAAALVAFDAGCGVPAAVAVVREMREAYVRLLESSAADRERLAQAFGDRFVAALRRRLPAGGDLDEICAAGLDRYEHLMTVAAAALNPSADRASEAAGLRQSA